MSARPKDPSVTVYAPVARLHVGRYEYGSGLVSVRHDRLNYTDTCGRQLVNVSLRDIQNMSVKTAYVDTGIYVRPCSCCPCAGCPDGVLNITAKGGGGGIADHDVHIGIAMPNPQEFLEKLNAEINRQKSGFASTE